jgi:tetratricopeptide (TPR) repeat protein
MATKPMVTVQHAAQTDHTIPRVARVAAIGNQSETSLTPFPGTAPPERETALAYASAALEANDRALGMQAFEMLRALLPRLPADVTVADQLAQLYDKRGQSTEACRLFLDAANSDTPPTGALVNAGGCLAKAERLTEAIELWKKALHQNPAEEAARLNLAVALARSGDVTAARATLQEGLRFDPFFSKASQLLADLR